MLRELNVTLTGRHSNPTSLSQPLPPSDSGIESPDQDMDDEEVSFDVKVDVALSGECIVSVPNRDIH